MPASTGFEFSFGRAGQAREPQAPMRLLVLGDFRGDASADRPPLAERPTLRVDLDNFDGVLARLAPQVTTAAGRIRLTALDNFHPDALFRSLDLFGALREARTRPAPTGADSPLTALLGGAPTGAAVHKTPQDGIESLLHRVVAPHIVPDTRAQTQSYLQAVDAAIAEQMRGVLHAPAFQSLEAAWRGLWWLVSQLELDENLQVHLFDVSQEELLADLDPARGIALEQTASHAALVTRARRQPGGATGWSALIGLQSLGDTPDELHQLAALGALGSHAGGPYIGAAEAGLWRNPENEQAQWTELRRSEAARWVGLVAPRLLLRRPYGVRDEPVEAFVFEEQPRAHEHYLWGSGALAFALLLGRSYRLNEGWSFVPGEEREIDDLPACTWPGPDGEPELVPCAEQFLSDQDAEGLVRAGLMPLLSHAHRNVAMLLRWQSIAAPSAPLRGLPG